MPPPRQPQLDASQDPEKSDAKETKDETARNVNETTEPDPADTGRPTRGAAAAARSREEAEKASPTPAAATPPKAEKEDAQMMDVDKMTDVDTTAHVDDDARTPVLMTRPARAFPETPPPSRMTAIDQWAVAKLVGDVARLKRDVVRDLLSEKEEEEEGRDGKKGKKGSKKLTAAEKKKAEKEAEKKEKEAKKKGSSRRRGGRGAAAKDDDEDEDDDEDDDDDDDAEKDADGATAADTAAKDAEKEVTDAAAVGGAADATVLMPPPVPPYLPGGATDASLDAELDLDSVAPGTPPRFSETDPEAVFGSKSAVTYACSGGAASEWRRKTAQMEAAKFAAYEMRLRDWEESEKRRQRALAEARRRAEENEHIAAIETRRRARAAALAEARRFEHAAAQRAAAEAKAKALGKRGRGAMAGDSDSSDDDEDGLTLAALAGGQGGQEIQKGFGARSRRREKEKVTPQTRAVGGRGEAVDAGGGCASVCDRARVREQLGVNHRRLRRLRAVQSSVHRRAEQCRWRFQQLTRSAEEGGDPAAAAALNLDKGTARQTMSRALPVEDNTARVHFDRAAQAQARHAKARRLAAAERAGDDGSRRAPPHAFSWGAHRGLRGLDRRWRSADHGLLEGGARRAGAGAAAARADAARGTRDPGWVPGRACSRGTRGHERRGAGRGGGSIPGQMGGQILGGTLVWARGPRGARGPGGARPGGRAAASVPAGRECSLSPLPAAAASRPRSTSSRCSSSRCRCSGTCRRSGSPRAQRRCRRSGSSSARPGRGAVRAGPTPRRAPAPARLRVVGSVWVRRTRPFPARPPRWRCPRSRWRGGGASPGKAGAGGGGKKGAAANQSRAPRAGDVQPRRARVAR